MPHVIRRVPKITDDEFLSAMRTARALRPHGDGVTRWDIACVLAGRSDDVRARELDPYLPNHADDFPEAPQRLVLGVARRLIKKGTIVGCDCGCAGFFTLAEETPAYHPWRDG